MNADSTLSTTATAARYGIGRQALARHLKTHAVPTVRAALEPREGLDGATVLGRALALADDVREVRRTAQAAGDRRDVLRAADSEARVLALLSVRLGVDEESTAQALAEAHRLAVVVGQVSRSNPEVGEVLARALENNGANEMADALRAQFSETRRSSR